jgi:hypothetical protein
MIYIDGVPYLSVGDAITLARMAQEKRASLEQYAQALAMLAVSPPTPVEKKKKPKPKTKRRKANGR